MAFLRAANTDSSPRVRFYTRGNRGVAKYTQWEEIEAANRTFSRNRNRWPTLEIEIEATEDRCSAVTIDLSLLTDSMTVFGVHGVAEHGVIPEVVFVASDSPKFAKRAYFGLLRGTDFGSFHRSVVVQDLYLDDMNLAGDKLPESLWNSDLRMLSVKNTHLPYLPRGISKASWLYDLTVSDAGLMELPSSISRMPNLRDIDASGNNLSRLPDMPRLRLGKFANNLLREIPEWAHRRRLFINIHDNPIGHGSCSPDATKGDYLGTDIEPGPSLDLSRNRIMAVPPWIPSEQLADFRAEDDGRQSPWHDEMASHVLKI